MSLDWDVSKIDNYQEVTTKIVDGKKKWADETNTLVWGTICGVGLHSITEKNVEEWIFRVRFLKELGYHWMEQFDEDHNVIGYWPDDEDIRRHIGLSTNAVPAKTRNQFYKDTARRIEERVYSQLRRDKRAAEREEKKHSSKPAQVASPG